MKPEDKYKTDMILLNKTRLAFQLTISLSFCLLQFLAAQTQSNVVVFNRGRLWHAYHYAQECLPMSDWQRVGYGLDWPGFNPADNSIPEIGGSHSYLVSGGFYLTALNDSGEVQGWDNFATNGQDAKGWQGDQNRYLVKRHEKRWDNGDNYWLQADPNEAEEVMDSQIDWNGSWYQPWDNQVIPLNIKRTARQWSGSKADQDYIITDYTFVNPNRRKSVDGVFLLFTYALSPNNRGWNLTFPNLPDGARNTVCNYDPALRLITARAGDSPDTPLLDDSFDRYENQRFDPVLDEYVSEPEFTAPGFIGIKFLYISADSTGLENRINGFAWSAAPPSQDHSGPFLGIAGLDQKYEAMADPMKLSEAFSDPQDTRMGSSRLYANFSIGPFDIAGRDSVTVVIAEFVGGASYEDAIREGITSSDIEAAGDSAVQYLSQRVEFNYNHQYRVPVPPVAPDFTVSSLDSTAIVANVITFSNISEMIPDPHQQTVDIAGYRIYRSGNLPFGPWKLVADIPAGDPGFLDEGASVYRYVDRQVALGYRYYYALTAYDTGHDSWAVDPAVRVPALESSLFANRTTAAFATTLLPPDREIKQVTVVPNPFYRVSGLPRLGDENLIQFVNLNRDCTIRIFTVRGDLVKTIHHQSTSSGVASWNQISDNGQLVRSGLYMYHVENQYGDTKTGKFAIVK